MTTTVKVTTVPVPVASVATVKVASPVVTTTAAAKTKVANPVVAKAVGVAVIAPITPAAPTAVKNTASVAGSDTAQPAAIGKKAKTTTTSPVVGSQTNGHASYL